MTRMTTPERTHDEPVAARGIRAPQAIAPLVLTAILLTFYMAMNLLAVWSDSPTHFLDSDDKFYIGIAHNLYFGGHYGETWNAPTQQYALPGLPYTLFAFMKVFGPGFPGLGLLAFKFFQALLQCVVVILVADIARRVMDTWASAIVVAMSVLYMPDYWTTGLIMTEVPFKFLTVLFLYVAFLAVERRSWVLFACTGLILGAACLFRPILAVFPLCMAALFWYRGIPRSVLVKGFLAGCACFVIVMTPWWIRNYRLLDRFVMFMPATALAIHAGSSLGQNTAVKNDPKAPKESAYKDLNSFEAAVRTYSRQRILREFAEKPGSQLYWYLFEKPHTLWARPYYWYPLFGVDQKPIQALHWMYLGWSVVGALIVLRNRWKAGWLLVAFLAYYTAIYTPFITFDRYNYPAMPVVILTAALGLRFVLRGRATEQWGSAPDVARTGS